MDFSSLGSVDWKDFGKGLLLTILAALVAVLKPTVLAAWDLLFSSTTMPDFATLFSGHVLYNAAKVALMAGIAYAFKQLSTNNQGQLFTKDKK